MALSFRQPRSSIRTRELRVADLLILRRRTGAHARLTWEQEAKTVTVSNAVAVYCKLQKGKNRKLGPKWLSRSRLSELARFSRPIRRQDEERARSAPVADRAERRPPPRAEATLPPSRDEASPPSRQPRAPSDAGSVTWPGFGTTPTPPMYAPRCMTPPDAPAGGGRKNRCVSDRPMHPSLRESESEPKNCERMQEDN